MTDSIKGSALSVQLDLASNQVKSEAILRIFPSDAAQKFAKHVDGFKRTQSSFDQAVQSALDHISISKMTCSEAIPQNSTSALTAFWADPWPGTDASATPAATSRAPASCQASGPPQVEETVCQAPYVQCTLAEKPLALCRRSWKRSLTLEAFTDAGYVSVYNFEACNVWGCSGHGITADLSYIGTSTRRSRAKVLSNTSRPTSLTTTVWGFTSATLAMPLRRCVRT